VVYRYVKWVCDHILPRFARQYVGRIEQSPLASRFAHGAFWSVAGATVARLLGLASSIIIARYLGKEEFGALGILYSTIAMYQLFAGFGLGMTGLKYVAEYKKKNPVKAGRIIALSYIIAVSTGVVVAALLAIFAEPIASRTLNAPHLANLLRISALTILAGAFNGAQTGALAGFEAFKSLARISLLIGIVTVPITIGGVYFAGTEGVIWGMVVTMVLNAVFNNISLQREMKRHGISCTYSECFKEVKVLWDFSLPSLIESMMVVPVNWACSALLVNQEGGYAEMGVFSAANQWFGALLFLPSSVGQTVLPLLSEKFGLSDTKSSVKILSFSMMINALLLIPAVTALCLLSPLIMASYGDGFRESWDTLVVVAITAVLVGIQIPVGHVLVSSGKMWLGFFMNFGWAIVFLISTILLVRWGAMGLASARLAAYCFHGVWTFGWVYYFIKKG